MDIREKLRTHINNLFAGTPVTRANIDLKEELLSNSIERFSDLILQGKSPEDAYQIVIGSIGDINELVQPAVQYNSIPAINEEQRKKNAITKTACISLYMLAGLVLVISVFVSDFTNDFVFFGGLIGALTIAIVPTIILIYRAYAYPEYKKCDDSVVEEFKEFSGESNRNKAISESIQSTMWILIVVIYFVISFTTGAWGYTWIIYLIGAALTGIINNIFKIKGMK